MWGPNSDKGGVHSSSYLIKVSNNFIQEPQALGSLVVDGKFSVELVEIWDWSEDNTHPAVALVVQVLWGASAVL